ncbi:MAG TPA: hypothetical protein VGQ12_07430 [Candidatus Angelobacter sp.]|jgi:hypothetical protein|nr:hypothetical protein [Candidatus Angelobacter sp.]
MIRAKSGDLLMLVIEPGNIDRIKKNMPIDVPTEGAQRLMIFYSPDVVYMQELCAQGVPFAEALELSQVRPPVHERPYVPPSELRNVKVSGEPA